MKKKKKDRKGIKDLLIFGFIVTLIAGIFSRKKLKSRKAIK